ncbi:MAG: DUF1697 domain-containing protein [Burkholderiales bacterium]|nr:DUF1697 domain-containing protein [Burkholderiales bacterium]MDE2455785.1 DUF1697 domain-containing protein [Burkholderiales bacterium]
MTRFVAFFRGINVGKARRLAMADLRALFLALGYGDPRTLLNSGNVVFSGGADAERVHAARIRTAVASRLGVDAPVIVKTAGALRTVVAENALAASAGDASRLLVALVDDPQLLRRLGRPPGAADDASALHVGAEAAYLWCPQGILKTPAALHWLGGLGKGVTTRNWATIVKLEGMLRAGTPGAQR